ncbi:long-chain-fatty-acid--CoA ligase [Nocardiopsis aegyptia]|uniref:Long-chain acyl-CoA synthetase n=1 Tax=Nocardiopsis aegyptia TaxID=220378 RepID=A0A7Z0EPG6_9ACTN|nr:long-chain fatty acid--CoA ligase [Nocardiopsis aegyptia]NYJ35023.1 long-chain acyl-CoA synthetase [Nocardiopsis aegyptia]
MTTAFNLAGLLDESAEKYPRREAIVCTATGSRLEFAQLRSAANQVANLLVSRGVQKGDKVALSCVNIPAFSIVYWGALKAGATVVPLNVLFKEREVAYHLDDSGAKAYFCFQGTAELPIGREGHAGFTRAEACEHFFMITADPSADSPIDGTETLAQATKDMAPEFECADTDEDDTAVILYTSGTTGQPKGAELRHSNMRDNALAGADIFGLDAERPDTFLCVLPLFHSFGQTVIQNAAVAYGGSVVMLPRFEGGSALRLMRSEGITFFAGVPTMYWGLIGALKEAGDELGPQNLERLRVAVSGGSALPAEVHREFEERFGMTILEGYGLSETSPVASFSVWGEKTRVGSIGKPIPGVEMKLIDPDSWNEVDPGDDDAVGEIAVRGHNVMKGYHGRPEATVQAIRNGWFRTGDLGRRDEDGWYYIVDRAKDMIIRGGYNVYPREVEEVLMTHPDVSLAAVVGVAHETHGEEVKAFVIRDAGATITEDALVVWAKGQMAAYKYPRQVAFVDRLPMNATGKILKRELT